jgi:hypothetical protein
LKCLATEDVGIFDGHVVNFPTIGIFYGHLVIFPTIWYILWQFGINFPRFGKSSPFGYIGRRFGMLYHEESGNPVCRSINVEEIWS